METIPELLYIDNEQLKDLLYSEEKLEVFIESLPDVGAILSRCQQLTEENVAMAGKNLELKNDFEKARDQTLTKVQELASLQAGFEQLNLKHQQLTEKLAPSNLQELTLIGAAESEEESEQIAETFLQNSGDVNKFLTTYLDKRIEGHLRKFKGERLGTQLQELHKAGF